MDRSREAKMVFESGKLWFELDWLMYLEKLWECL